MVEQSREPTAQQKFLVNRAAYLRGQIVASYSQVEFLLADISVKLNLIFPYRIKDRIQAVRKISDRPNYELYKEKLNKVCDDLLEYDELRNFMAHGFASLTTDKKGNHEFEFRMYQRESQGKFNLVTIKTTIPYLEIACKKITRYVSDTVTLFSRIYLEQKLEE